MNTKPKVLIVEDTKLVAEQITRLLAGLACSPEMHVVSTEDEAMEALADFRPSIAILDLKLKRGTGFNVLRTIRDEKFPALAIIVFTNYAIPPYRDFAMLMGADYFLDKAVDFETLPGIVESIAESFC